MQPISSRIWTRVAMYISRDDIHYTTGNDIYCHTQKTLQIIGGVLLINLEGDWLVLRLLIGDGQIKIYLRNI